MNYVPSISAAAAIAACAGTLSAQVDTTLTQLPDNAEIRAIERGRLIYSLDDAASQTRSLSLLSGDQPAVEILNFDLTTTPDLRRTLLAGDRLVYAAGTLGGTTAEGVSVFSQDLGTLAITRQTTADPGFEDRIVNANGRRLVFQRNEAFDNTGAGPISVVAGGQERLIGQSSRFAFTQNLTDGDLLLVTDSGVPSMGGLTRIRTNKATEVISLDRPNNLSTAITTLPSTIAPDGSFYFTVQERTSDGQLSDVYYFDGSSTTNLTNNSAVLRTGNRVTNITDLRSSTFGSILTESVENFSTGGEIANLALLTPSGSTQLTSFGGGNASLRDIHHTDDGAFFLRQINQADSRDYEVYFANNSGTVAAFDTLTRASRFGSDSEAYVAPGRTDVGLVKHNLGTGGFELIRYDLQSGARSVIAGQSVQSQFNERSFADPQGRLFFEYTEQVNPSDQSTWIRGWSFFDGDSLTKFTADRLVDRSLTPATNRLFGDAILVRDRVAGFSEDLTLIGLDGSQTPLTTTNTGQLASTSVTAAGIAWAVFSETIDATTLRASALFGEEVIVIDDFAIPAGSVAQLATLGVSTDSLVFGLRIDGVVQPERYYFTIPAPASAAVLGVAGLAATRRRR